MKYDGNLDLAIGASAKSKKWKNTTIKWSKLVSKLSSPVRTMETAKEYRYKSKDDRSSIKDVGGYVGAYLNNGKRSPKTVVHRQLLTLDIDYANLDFWDIFTMQFDNAAVLHATHSHTNKSPRYRLIIPINRECLPDEYVAIARNIAGVLGIELFDSTTFETNRLMFWPSVSSDVEYYFEQQDGPWVDADEILDSYIDWKDSSLWPTAGRELQEVRDLSKKQQNPLSKAGIVGTFCRTYTAEEAIETFLSDVYSATKDGRYTYVHGSTSGGVVLYDDMFAYSHHGSDPIGGQLCNSFDLVRIHKFGDLDIDSKATGSKAPSFKQMEKFATDDELVKKQIAVETIQQAKYEFADVELDDDEEIKRLPDDVEWAKELEVDTRGRYLSNSTNLNIIFNNDPNLCDSFTFNKFDSKRYVVKQLPWRKVDSLPEPVKNVDYSGVRNYIESVYGIVGNVKVEDALSLLFERNSYHPIRDYLKSLEWDGKNRLDTVLIDYFGAEDTSFTREAIRKTLTAAVARIFNPGVKFDLVLTLIGSQGTGKSTFVDKLGLGWSSDTFMTVNGKEAFDQLRGAWMIELAELAGLRKAEVEAVKHFITKREDTYRQAYARTQETYKRQCVFIGTTNTKDFLTDSTGNRRFMPVDVRPEHVTKSIFKITRETIDQIWAEAVVAFNAGEELYLSGDAEREAKEEQARHTIVDDRRGIVSSFLDHPITDDWEDQTLADRMMYFDDDLDMDKGDVVRQYVCIAELWCVCFGRKKSEMSRHNTRPLNEIMKSLPEWEYMKTTKNFAIYGKQKYYKRKVALDADVESMLA